MWLSDEVTIYARNVAYFLESPRFMFGNNYKKTEELPQFQDDNPLFRLSKCNSYTAYSKYFTNTNLSKSSNTTSLSALSPFSSFSALQRGKATPVVIHVCPRCRSLSFFDCNSSSECQVSFLSGASESFLGSFFNFFPPYS